MKIADLWTQYEMGAVNITAVIPNAPNLMKNELISALTAAGYSNIVEYQMLSVMGQAINPAILLLKKQGYRLGSWIGVQCYDEKVANFSTIILAFKRAGDMALLRTGIAA